MKILFVYPPFCTPTIMPYSISYLKSFIANNVKIEAKCLDLNAKFHRIQFQNYYDNLKKASDMKSYSDVLTAFEGESRLLYSEAHKTVRQGILPPLLKEMLQLIIFEKPDFVAFSIVYNSQSFYAGVIARELVKNGIKCIAGGPADLSPLKESCTILQNEVELAEFLDAKKPHVEYNCRTVPDFSDYSKDDYLSKETIIPIRTSTSCPYRQCAFCTHHGSRGYLEFPLPDIKKTIEKADARYVFFIDDMLHKKRLLDMAALLKPLNVKWWCQLRPEREIISHLRELHDSGLKSVSWGVESGSQRVLDMMKKGTRVADIENVLKESHSAGIINNVYVIFGFPTETKEEFRETIAFIDRNKENIDLILTSIFGLQKGSRVYNNPEEYSVTGISEEKRTVLEPKITYTVKEGMSQEEAEEMRRNHARFLRKIDKLPKAFNYFREQVLLF